MASVRQACAASAERHGGGSARPADRRPQVARPSRVGHDGCAPRTREVRQRHAEVGSPFLTARWENLILLNFDCPSGLLEPLVPTGLQLDPWRGSHVLSLVGFHFVDTRVLGLPIPWHRTFEEVNLRLYVRRLLGDASVRRGVVFIKELVPRRAVAAVARWTYDEPYRTARMGHRIALDPEIGGELEYSWDGGDGRHVMAASVEGPAAEFEPSSEGAFITERYWGYGRRRDGSTVEYRVDHPPWRGWEATSFDYVSPRDTDVYPREFKHILDMSPRSVFVALGSEVSVFPGADV